MLSTKIYWERPEQREKYKKFWNQYEQIEKIQNKEEEEKQKEILFISADLKEVCTNENKYYKIIKFYKNKLVELGAMKTIKGVSKTQGEYVGRKILCKK